jgi:hypothetical protein
LKHFPQILGLTAPYAEPGYPSSNDGSEHSTSSAMILKLSVLPQLSEASKTEWRSLSIVAVDVFRGLKS